MLQPFRIIYDWLDNYFSQDERNRIKELGNNIRNLSIELSGYKQTLQKCIDERKKLANDYILINEENKALKKTLASYSSHQTIITSLNKTYRRVLLAYTKRWVLTKTNNKEVMLFDDFVRPSTTLREWFKKYSEKQVWTFPIRYIRDNYAYNGILDVWQLPLETYTLGGGDCDDTTALRVSIAKSIGLENDGSLYFMAVGEYVDGKQRIGHCFPIKINSAGEWYVLEATSNTYKPLPYPNNHYIIEYMTDGHTTWQIRGYQSYGGRVLKKFDLEKS